MPYTILHIIYSIFLFDLIYYNILSEMIGDSHVLCVIRQFKFKNLYQYIKIIV